MMSRTTSSSNKVAANDTGRSAPSGEFCVTGEVSPYFNRFSFLSGEADQKVCDIKVRGVAVLSQLPDCPVCAAHDKAFAHPFILKWGVEGGCPFFYFTTDAWGLTFRTTKERKLYHETTTCNTCLTQEKQLDEDIGARYQAKVREEETRRREEEKAASEKRLREEKLIRLAALRKEKAAEEKRLRKEKAAEEKRLRKEKAILERLVAARKEKADLEAMLHEAMLRKAHFDTEFKKVVGAIRHYSTVLVHTMADAEVKATKLSGSIKRSNERKRKLTQFWRNTRTSLGVCPTSVLAVDELTKLTLVTARLAIMESYLPCKLVVDAELAFEHFLVVIPEEKLVREVEALVLSDDDSSDDEKKDWTEVHRKTPKQNPKKNDWTEVHRKTPKSKPKKLRHLTKNDTARLSKARNLSDLNKVMSELGLSFAGCETLKDAPCGRIYADPCQTPSCRGHQSGCFKFHNRTTTICLHDIKRMLGAKSDPCALRCNCGKVDCECRWRVHAQSRTVIAPCARGTKPGPCEKVVGPCTYLHPFAELGCDKLQMFREEPDGSHVEEALPVLLALEIYQRQQDEEEQKQREEAQKTPVEQKNQSRPKRRPREHRYNKQSDVEKGSIFDTRHAKVVRKKLDNKSNISPEKELYLRKNEEERLAAQEKLQQRYRQLKEKHARGEHLTSDECKIIRVPFRNSYDDLSSSSLDEEEDDVEDDEKVVEDTVLPLFVVVRLRALARAARQHVARQTEDLKRKLAEVAERDVTWYLVSGGKRSKRRHRRSQKKRSMGLNEFFQDDQPPTLSLRVVLRLRARLRTIRREMQVAQEEERERLRKRNEKFDRTLCC